MTTTCIRTTWAEYSWKWCPGFVGFHDKIFNHPHLACTTTPLTGFASVMAQAAIQLNEEFKRVSRVWKGIVQSFEGSDQAQKFSSSKLTEHAHFTGIFRIIIRDKRVFLSLVSPLKISAEGWILVDAGLMGGVLISCSATMALQVCHRGGWG